MPPKKPVAPAAAATEISTTTVAPTAASKKKRVSFGASEESAVAKKKLLTQKKAPEGIVTARPTVAAKKAPAAPAKKKAPTTAPPQKKKPSDNNEEDDDSVSDDSDDSDESDDDLDAIADASSSDDESDMESGDSNDGISYKVLHLRFLPPEFQEPELKLFLGQYGARVVNCFCVRGKKSFLSRGIAYVQFDREDVLESLQEECHGMLLGGRTISASIREMHRPMPASTKTHKLRIAGWNTMVRGCRLTRHNAKRKDIVGSLLKYSKSEKANNKNLKRLGIDYVTTDFQDQLARVPKTLMKSPEELKAAKAEKAEKAALAKSNLQKFIAVRRAAKADLWKRVIKANHEDKTEQKKNKALRIAARDGAKKAHKEARKAVASAAKKKKK